MFRPKTARPPIKSDLSTEPVTSNFPKNFNPNYEFINRSNTLLKMVYRNLVELRQKCKA